MDVQDSGAAVQALPWQVHTASAQGAWHVKDGRPNEDAVAHELAPGLLVVAVADGHGDARHFRSDRGAKMAVTAGVSAMRDWSAGLSGGTAESGIAEIRQSAQRGLVPDVVDRWNAAVAADLAADQFTEAEGAILADLALPPVTAYGSTLLIGAFTGEHGVFAQIGDGSILAVLPDGRPVGPVPEDRSLDGTHTTSLCLPNATASFRIGVIRLADRPVYAVLLATDGFGNAQAEDPWQPGVAADLVRFGLDHDQNWFASQVPKWAAQCASSNGSGDDSTIALAINSSARLSREVLPLGGSHRKPAAETLPARTLKLPEPTTLRLPEPTLAADRPRSRNRAWAWIAVAAAAVVAIALVLVFLLTGNGQRSPGRTPGSRPSQVATLKPTPTPSASVGTSPNVGPSTPSTPPGASSSVGGAGGAAGPTVGTPP